MNDRLKDKLRRRLIELEHELLSFGHATDVDGRDAKPDVEAIVDIVEEVLDGKMVRT